jgi:transcriptional regulator with XRE-family HTH domain/predicted ATPase
VPDDLTLGDLIQRYRLVRGWSQETLAQRAEVSPQAVSDIETGVTRMPRPSTLARLSAALGLAPDQHERLVAAATIDAAGPEAAGAATDAGAAAPPAQPADLAGLLGWLRHGAGLNRTQLAERAGLSAKALQNIEKGITLRIRAGTAVRLADALRLTGAERFRFLACATGVTLPERADGAVPPPSRAHLHGRVREYAHLCRVLPTAPLVTVTGPAGSGKTTLVNVAVDAVAPAATRLRLAHAPAGTDALRAITSLIGADDTGVAAISAKLAPDSVVVLDNLEHLGDPAGAVTALRAARPDLRLVTTSRRALGLPGELVITLGALDLDAARTVFGAAAVRAGATAPPDADRGVVEQICDRVDRLPLAIELAAARSAVLGPRDILAQLAQPIRLLRRPRADPGDPHATLIGAIDWSLRLLTADAARLIQTIAAYRAPWPLPLLARVHDSAELLDSLHELAEAHLLVVETDAPATCFSLLQTVDDVAGEHLRTGCADPAVDDAGSRPVPAVDEAGVRERHAATVTGLATANAAELLGADQESALATLDTLSAHVDAAIDHLLGVRDPRALGLAAPMWRYWQIRNRYRHGLSTIERCLAQPDPANPTEVIATARYGAAVLAHLASLDDVAIPHARAALDGYRAVGDAHGQGGLLSLLGMITLHHGDLAGALAWYERGLREVTPQAAPRAYTTLLANVAPVYRSLGHFDRASRAAEEAAIRYRRLGDAHGVALQLGNLARWSVLTGDIERARDLINDALVTFEQLGDLSAASVARLLRVEIALDSGDVSLARQELDVVRQLMPKDDRWNTTAADVFAAELSLLDGAPRLARTDAAVALSRAEDLGYHEGALRALLVLAAASLHGREPAALDHCRDALTRCQAGDPRAVASFALLVDGALAASGRASGPDSRASGPDSHAAGAYPMRGPDDRGPGAARGMLVAITPSAVAVASVAELWAGSVPEPLDLSADGAVIRLRDAALERCDAGVPAYRG